jgi:thiamine kinase
MGEIDQVLQGWQGWNVPWTKPPCLERELAGGSTNRNYLIRADERLWVLRINGRNSKTIGIDRRRESAIVKCAAAAGIAPAIAYCSPESGLLITEFIDGRHWETDELDDPERLGRLLDLVTRIHELEVEATPIDYYAHAERYWVQLVSARFDVPDTLRRERETLLEQLITNHSDKPYTHLCHHDLNPSNIIDQNGRLYLLDWEYAAYGSPAFDYASIGAEWGVPIERLPRYVGIDAGALNDAARLYQYICRLWALLNEGSSSDQSRD